MCHPAPATGGGHISHRGLCKCLFLGMHRAQDPATLLLGPLHSSHVSLFAVPRHPATFLPWGICTCRSSASSWWKQDSNPGIRSRAHTLTVKLYCFFPFKYFHTGLRLSLLHEKCPVISNYSTSLSSSSVGSHMSSEPWALARTTPVIQRKLWKAGCLPSTS